MVISDNDFREQDLSFLSHLDKLWRLDLSNFINGASGREKNLNRFVGSLKPLQGLKNLTHLNIDDTDISVIGVDSGLEYLPSKI